MNKGLTFIKIKFPKCILIYLLLIFIFLISLNCSHCFPIDKHSIRNFARIPQQNLLALNQSSPNLLNTGARSKTKPHHRYLNQIITTVYDPFNKKYLDPYEITDRGGGGSLTIPKRYENLDMDSTFNRQIRAANLHHRNQTLRTKHYCPGQDVATRTFFAPTVFEAKVRSMSSNKRPHYAVTFEVKVVYKNQSKFKPLVKNETIRLHFAHGRGTNCDCLDNTSFNNTLVKSSSSSSTIIKNTNNNNNINILCGSLVKARLRPGKTYILFLNRVGVHNYTVLGPPVASSNKSLHAVMRVMNIPNSGKSTQIYSSLII